MSLKLRKRKREEAEVSEDETDSDYDGSIDQKKLVIRKTNKHNQRYYDDKMRTLEKVSREREIMMDDVLNLKLNEDDNVWFYDYISIREECDDLEQRIKIKNKIYSRFNLLKKLKSHKLMDTFQSPEEDIMNRIMLSKQTERNKMMLINLVKDKVKNTESEEYQKTIDLVNVVLQIPQEVKSKYSNVAHVLANLERKMDEKMFGMHDVKSKIMESVCSIMCSSDNEGKILTLVGPPGVGKTTICSVIAEALGIGFAHISLGSIKDPHDLCGHSSTYISSKPGLFLNILRESGRLDNLILLDEVDKIYNKSHDSTSISTVLLHVLDPQQNNKIRDSYCQDFPFDMSKTFFVLSCNSVDLLDAPLKDRMEIVNVRGYTINEKASIANIHMIPKQIDKFGLNNSDYKFTIKDLENIIELFTDEGESGVRGVKRLFGTIFAKILLCEKISTKSKYAKNMKILKKRPLKIDTSLVSKILDQKK